MFKIFWSFLVKGIKSVEYLYNYVVELIKYGERVVNIFFIIIFLFVFCFGKYRFLGSIY